MSSEDILSLVGGTMMIVAIIGPFSAMGYAYAWRILRGTT